MGRPTKDLLTVMGMVVLQQIHDLTDEQACEQLAFNQQWHYALQTYNPEEQVVCQKTFWSVRQRMTKSPIAEAIFDKATVEFAKMFNVDTRNQRLDSVHVFSNMARLGRVRLLSKTITNFVRNLKRSGAEEIAGDRLKDIIERYGDEKREGYFGEVKPSASQKRLNEIATDMYYLYKLYSAHPAISGLYSYKQLARAFNEQCKATGDIAEAIPAKEVSADSLQNPSDPDAGYDAHKGRGYQVQLAETYSRKAGGDESPSKLELITHVIVESADNHDSGALAPTVNGLEAKGLKPAELLADTSYGSDDNVNFSIAKEVALISPVAGKKSAKDFAGFTLSPDKERIISCPQGCEPDKVRENKKDSVTLYWNNAKCNKCKLSAECHAKKGKKYRQFRYSAKDIRLWERRVYEGGREFRDKYRYRSGIEATNARFVQMTGARRVRYRGLKNVAFAEILKALGINMFRVRKYVADSGKLPVFSRNIEIFLAIVGKIFKLLLKKYFKVREMQFSPKLCMR
jgi:hypothetical protein